MRGKIHYYFFKKKSIIFYFDRSQLRRPLNNCRLEIKSSNAIFLYISRFSLLKREIRWWINSRNNSNAWNGPGAARDLEPPLLYARWTEEFRGGKVLSRVRPTSQKNAVVVFSGRAFNGHVQRSVPISNATKNGPRFRNWLDPRSLILNHGPISPVRFILRRIFHRLGQNWTNKLFLDSREDSRWSRDRSRKKS